MEESSSRVKAVLDKLPQTGPAYVASASVRKQSKQQRRSSAGIGRDLNEALPGLAVEWNLEIEKSWVWNDNQDVRGLVRCLAAPSCKCTVLTA